MMYDTWIVLNKFFMAWMPRWVVRWVDRWMMNRVDRMGFGVVRVTMLIIKMYELVS